MLVATKVARLCRARLFANRGRMPGFCKLINKQWGLFVRQAIPGLAKIGTLFKPGPDTRCGSRYSALHDALGEIVNAPARRESGNLRIKSPG
ncbi:hypothetical protein [Metallibacterium sp.]|uniref:hypothetical protein n=1 Tax=Metallibacterium sp. TaxID=2940281 RepID=UPI00263070FE|nr:hypothetical protein [Metallibacterium sp.]